MPESTPRQIGPYRLCGRLGAGAMGTVYLGEHLETGVEVALKTLRQATAALVPWIRREIRTLSRLAHPGVVRVLDSGLEGGVPWYAMELLDGLTLRDQARHLRQQPAMSGPAGGDARGEANVLTNLGGLCYDLGEARVALAHWERALILARVLGERHLEGIALANVAVARMDQGRLEESRRGLRTALAIHRAVGYRQGEGFCLLNLGIVDLTQGLTASARQALEPRICRPHPGARARVAYLAPGAARRHVRLAARQALRRAPVARRVLVGPAGDVLLDDVVGDRRCQPPRPARARRGRATRRLGRARA